VKVVTADPEDMLPYECEFAGDYPDTDTIVDEDVVSDDPAVTVSDIGHDGTRVVAWATGGTIGTTVQLKCTITTTGGYTIVRRTSLLIRHR
jgi:hypothetical protein